MGRQVDVVLECSGKVETLEPYFAAGVKTVIVAAPVKSGAVVLAAAAGVGARFLPPTTAPAVSWAAAKGDE